MRHHGLVGIRKAYTFHLYSKMDTDMPEMLFFRQQSRIRIESSIKY